jgi:hypothetical protein
MTDDRYTLLNPPQVAATLRSLPRRYRDALAQVPMRPEAVHERVDGHTVHDLLVDTACSLAMLDRALEQTLVHETPPVLVAAVVDRELRHWAPDPHSGPTELVEAITDAATACADRIDGERTKAWSRPASVVGGGTVLAIDLARDAARVGAENLRTIERIAPKLLR